MAEPDPLALAEKIGAAADAKHWPAELNAIGRAEVIALARLAMTLRARVSELENALLAPPPF